MAQAVLESILGMEELAASALPYFLDERMLKALLNARGPFPTCAEVDELAKNGSLGAVTWFVLSVDKTQAAGANDQPPGEAILFLMELYNSLASKENDGESPEKEMRDKLAIFALHQVATRWPKLGRLCSGLSSSIIRRNEAMKRAVYDEHRRCGERLMFSGAVVGSIIRLNLRFKKRMPGPVRQLDYLLHELDEPEERCRLLAVARACNLMKDPAFVEKGGMEKVLGCFKGNAAATSLFLQEHLNQIVETASVA